MVVIQSHSSSIVSVEISNLSHSSDSDSGDLRRQASVKEDGIFWKRISRVHFPCYFPTPTFQKSSYKNLFVQEWFAKYISELDPLNIEYVDIIEMAELCSPFINTLKIKELKSAQFEKTEPPNADANEALANMSWLKETCLQVLPYIRRLDLSVFLPLLMNLTELSISFGFSNYERFRCFRKSRIHLNDIENLFKGIKESNQITSLTIYMSAIYETDMVVAVRSLVLHPICLSKLEVSHCELDDRAAMVVGDLILFHETLQEINLRRNYITKTGAYFIASAICRTKQNCLKLLTLTENGIGCVGALYLGLMLSVNENLSYLNISACRIGKKGAMFLLSCIRYNKSLVGVDLSVNQIGKISPDHEYVVVNIMKNHPTLVDLVLVCCDMDAALTQMLRLLGNEKRGAKKEEIVEQDGAILMKKDTANFSNWKMHPEPSSQLEEVYSTQSGELTSAGSTVVERELEKDAVPRKKLNRFMKATLTPTLVLSAMKQVLKRFHRLAIWRSQKTGKPLNKCFEEDLMNSNLHQLVKDEITRNTRRLMKKSKLFNKLERIRLRVPVSKQLINDMLKLSMTGIAHKVLQKVIERKRNIIHY